MGYTTNFEGRLKLNKQLSLDDYQWLKDWNEARHEESEGYPSYYCQWIPTQDGWFIEWDGSEKFYEYVEWLEWLIGNFFKDKGYILDGEIEWDGEEQGDVGKIIVKDNAVSIKRGKIVFE